MKHIQFTDDYPQNAKNLLKKWLNTRFWCKIGPLPSYSNIWLSHIKGKTNCSHHHSFNQLDASNHLAKTEAVFTSVKATILPLLGFAHFSTHFCNICNSSVNPPNPCSIHSHYSNFGLKLLFWFLRNQMISWVG